MTESNEGIPKGKQTVLGLYVTAKEAYEKWKADAEKVKILDVRTAGRGSVCGPSEYGLENPRCRSGV